MDVNGARGSLPFDEIPNNEVSKWYIGSTSTTVQPDGDLSLYSKLKTNVSFEPRDIHKGDLARAAFYFYTMYPDVGNGLSDLGDPELFYKWHSEDPVSATESERNNLIESYQNNRNPYIDSPEWVAKAWGFQSGNFPAVPDSFTLISDSNIVSLRWNDVENEDGYQLFRSIDNDPFERLVRLNPGITDWQENLSSHGEYRYYLKAWNHYGASDKTDFVAYDFVPVSIKDELSYLPDNYFLAAVKPNPFNPVSMITMTIIKQGHFVITVFNSSGYIPVGEKSFTWQPDNLSSGSYYILFTNRDRAKILKVLYLK